MVTQNNRYRSDKCTKAMCFRFAAYHITILCFCLTRFFEAGVSFAQIGSAVSNKYYRFVYFRFVYPIRDFSIEFSIVFGQLLVTRHFVCLLYSYIPQLQYYVFEAGSDFAQIGPAVSVWAVSACAVSVWGSTLHGNRPIGVKPIRLIRS